MNDAKTPKVLILIVAIALASAVVIAGCGGSGGTTATGQGVPAGSNTPEKTEETKVEEEPAEESESAEATEEESAAEEPAEEESGAPASEESGGESEAGSTAMTAEGKTIFTTTCGTCHTLSEAGTSGTVGPNLDELKPSESTVEHQVINGGGPMPAFGKEGTLSPEEVKAVATYVSSVAGTE